MSSSAPAIELPSEIEFPIELPADAVAEGDAEYCAELETARRVAERYGFMFVDMSTFRIRPAAGGDARFLADMLVEAANWNPLRARPRVAVLEDPKVSRDVVGFGVEAGETFQQSSDGSLLLADCKAPAFGRSLGLYQQL